MKGIWKSNRVVIHKEMAGYQRSHPECVYASNPFHECGTACLENIAEGKGRKDNKKKLGSVLSFGWKKKGSDSQPLSPRSGFESQPVTPRNGFESQPMTPRNVFDSRPKNPRNGIDSKPKKPPALEKGPAENAANPGDFLSPRSHFSFYGKNGESYSSTDHEIYSRDQSFDKAKVQPSPLVPTSGPIAPDHPEDTTRDGRTFVATATEIDKKLGLSDTVHCSISKDVREFTSDPVVQSSKSAHHSDPSDGSVTFHATATPTTQEKDAKEMRDHTSDQNARSLNFTFSGISRASEDSDEEDVQPEVSHVLVGKCHVKASFSFVLQSIFDKHGDILANCHLESAAMRAYYLESVCSIVEELRFASYAQIPKSKVKGMLAVLKDVESANIDVSWLHRLLDEIMESKELVNEHQAVEAAKANCDRALESTRKELESLMEDIPRKEKELSEARARAAEAKARLRDLELQSSQLSKTMSSLHSKVEIFRGKSLEDQLI